MANTKLYATGGQLSKSINNKFYPTNYTVPMLGFGDFLKNNAGTIGSLVGGAAGLFLGNPMLGAQIGGSIGGAFEGETKSQKDAALKAQMEAQQKQVMLQQLNDGTLIAAKGGLLPSYAGGGNIFDTTGRSNIFNTYVKAYDRVDDAFKNMIEGRSFTKTLSNLGSKKAQKEFQSYVDEYKNLQKDRSSELRKIADQFPEETDVYRKVVGPYNFSRTINNVDAITYAGGGGLNFKSPAAYKAWLAYGHASGEFAKTPGHQKVSIKGQPKKVQHADGGFMQPDNITMYAEGGFHETNPNGGIPIGNKALVEQGEVRYNSKKYGDYIFSDRF